MVQEDVGQSLPVKAVKTKRKEDDSEILPVESDHEIILLRIVQNAFLRQVAKETNQMAFQGKKNKIDRATMKQASRVVSARRQTIPNRRNLQG